MEYSYSRELKHNYLIVKRNNPVEDERREKSETYQIKIMESGKVKGFIPCDRRTINNQQFLYYEINSMQSLKDRFSSKGMDYLQVMQLLKNFKASLEGLSDYLLGIENVVLDTKSVFFDLNTEEFKFMYCPYCGEEKDFASFSDELFDLVEHDDEKAVEMVYNLSEQAHIEGCLVLDLVEKLLNGCEESVEDTTPQASTEYIPVSDVFMDNFEEVVPAEEEQKLGRIRKGGKVNGKVQLVFGGLFVLVIAAMMYIRMNYILSRQENTLSIIVMIVSVISALAAFISGVKDLIQKETPVVEEKSDDIEMPADSMVYDDFEYRQPVKAKAPVKVYPQECGETVLLGAEEEDKSMTLYSSNMDKTLRIPLDKLPLTIGKLEGCVDRVISDRSISRIHCKIMENHEGRPIIVDLNSTNGTFRNGLRLRPQEETVLEEGDEVRIGRICFDCR